MAGCAACLVGLVAGGCNEALTQQVSTDLLMTGARRAMVRAVDNEMNKENNQNGYTNDTEYEGNGQASPEQNARFNQVLRDRGMLEPTGQPSPEQNARFNQVLREHGYIK